MGGQRWFHEKEVGEAGALPTPPKVRVTREIGYHRKFILTPMR